MPKTNIDYIGNKGFQGEIAAYMQNEGKMNPGTLRPFVGRDNKSYITVFKGGDTKKIENYATVPIQNNATLRRDEWKHLDDAIMGISESRLGGVQDLIDHGLVFSLGNAMGSTVLEYQDVSDAMEADLTMDGVSRGKNDRPVYSTHYLPIPIIHVDYEINTRVLASSRSLGNALDTTSAERAARKVNQKLEDMLFKTDSTFTFGGGSIKSYTNFTDRNQVTLALNWDDSTMTGEKILADVVSMKQSSINAFHYGPWMLYIPTAYETVMDEDYNTSGTSTQTIRERLLKVGGIKGIKVVDTLAADNVILVQMTSDVVRLVRGMGITNVEWKTEGKFVNKYKVMTIQVPQIRSDQNGACGITHLASV